MLKAGLYEQVINKEIDEELSQDNRLKHIEPIDNAEASKVISKYICKLVEKGLDNVVDNGGDIKSQLSLANKIVTDLKLVTKQNDFDDFIIDERAEQLLAIIEEQNSIHGLDSKAKVVRPETSIAQSSLFTGAVKEPSLYEEIRKEIKSANRIDFLVSFIKWSGLRLIMNELREFTENGGKLRIITTSYMGATDIKAVEELRKLTNTEIKVSYNTTNTRLHAKTYVFYRDTHFSTAYIGSSNMSKSAMSEGLEWNVKVTEQDQPDTMKKIFATFESYWNSTEFEYYDETQNVRLSKALKAEKYMDANGHYQYVFDIQPHDFQKTILEQINAEREIRNNYKNLIIAATGTGKTVVSAFDYKRVCKKNGRQVRLLFVAHREEILNQSISCFRGVLKDANFGELLVGNNAPTEIDHLFVSIQSFNSKDLTSITTPDFYDYIIVDEFHHAAAESYQKLLEYYKPKYLLGLTATPERMDGKDILKYFNNRITAEIRLPEAIDRKLLCPFQYFGVTDTIDLTDLRWERGGYNKTELSNIYSFSERISEQRAEMIIKAVYKYVTDINDVKGLGFCVSKDHAEFMSNVFNKAGIPSIFLTSDTPDSERFTAKSKLINGEIRFIFVVDIYNEGVDIPDVNTVLFLRPTESLTIFLQQLGRGLRLAEGKECLTVLDFIGQANKKYDFASKFEALLSDSHDSVIKYVKDGFVNLPKGCYIQLEKKARDYILDNIKTSFGTRAGIISKLISFEDDSGLDLTLSHFVTYYHLDIRNIYATKYSFSRLCQQAGVITDFEEELEDNITKALARICAIDSRRWIGFLLNTLPTIDNVNINKLTECGKRMLRMFEFTIWPTTDSGTNIAKTINKLKLLQSSPVMFNEIIDLLKYNFEHIDFVDERVDVGFDCPLDLHCRYTRDQICVAMDKLNTSSMRQGVIWIPDKKCDVFLITLNKSEKNYSPSTMYNDYSINENLFHWQSQSTTSEQSPTGQRYINHKQKGSHVLLFVREDKNDKIGTSPFTFLGLAEHLKHEGSRPMNITWKLTRPIPARFIKKTNKLLG